ncbi:18821_t:CDS:2 [Entrophospora sp. SA101]|nr:9439_t:CDS:2 [Entrophospora sp. SA101]CAJ0632368.1 5090_t:CDS:2 [Entrophospora sp. SA101]CAJ0747347.1 18821_t:CDS:2 [Entrophospora sp. SA101]CAJ0843295.1 12122_t:CDS:2 [Entrophospora sp. SA101]CAJ0923603.1 21958_t:CDS:2 [Entrophospora sp. SA101]
MSNDTGYNPYNDPNAPYEDYPENTSFDDDVKRQQLDTILHKLNLYLSVVSISSGFLVLLIMTIMWFYDRKLVNRVSLRLTAMISFVDILTGGAVLAYTLRIPLDDPICTAIGFAMSFLPLLYLLLTVMIAFNLQIVFLHRKKVSSFSDRWYIPVAVLLASIINVPPLIYKVFGYDTDARECLYRNSFSEETKWWKFATFFVPITISMVYCTVVLMVVVCKLIFEHRKLAEVITTSKSNTTLTAKARDKKILLLKLVSRIALYSIIPLLSVSGIVVLTMYSSINKDLKSEPLPLILWSIIGSCLPGFFNCIAFLFDPALHNAFRKCKKDLVDSYGVVRPLLSNGGIDSSKTGFSLNTPPMSPGYKFSSNTPTDTTASFSSSNSSISNSNKNFNSKYNSTIYPQSTNTTSPTLTQNSFALGYMTNSQLSQQQKSSMLNKNKAMKWFVRTFLLDKKQKSQLEQQKSQRKQQKEISKLHELQQKYCYNPSTITILNPPANNDTNNILNNVGLNLNVNDPSYLASLMSLPQTTVNIHVHQYYKHRRSSSMDSLDSVNEMSAY